VLLFSDVSRDFKMNDGWYEEWQEWGARIPSRICLSPLGRVDMIHYPSLLQGIAKQVEQFPACLDQHVISIHEISRLRAKEPVEPESPELQDFSFSTGKCSRT